MYSAKLLHGWHVITSEKMLETSPATAPLLNWKRSDTQSSSVAPYFLFFHAGAQISEKRSHVGEKLLLTFRVLNLTINV